MTLASRMMSPFRSSTSHPRRKRGSVCLENLEGRLSLSAFGGTTSTNGGAAEPDFVSMRKHAPAEASVTPNFRQGSHIGTG
jgi:hypothetical protein